VSVAHCLPLPSSLAQNYWLVVVVIVIVAALCPGAAEILGITASVTAVVGVQLNGGRIRDQRGDAAT
jgi:hypothetical protein